jgi:hypothetical protein
VTGYYCGDCSLLSNLTRINNYSCCTSDLCQPNGTLWFVFSVNLQARRWQQVRVKATLTPTTAHSRLIASGAKVSCSSVAIRLLTSRQCGGSKFVFKQCQCGVAVLGPLRFLPVVCCLTGTVWGCLRVGTRCVPQWRVRTWSLMQCRMRFTTCLCMLCVLFLFSFASFSFFHWITFFSLLDYCHVVYNLWELQRLPLGWTWSLANSFSCSIDRDSLIAWYAVLVMALLNL